MTSITLKRVVVTGIGIVSPLGCGNELVWQHLNDGNIGIISLKNKISDKLIEETGVKIAGIVPHGTKSNDFDQKKLFIQGIEKELSLFVQYSILASDLALNHSKLKINLDDINAFDSTRAGVSIASGIGALQEIVNSSRLLDLSYKKLSPYFVTKILPNMASGHVSIRHKLQGPNICPATACAAGSHAIGDAYNLIRLGHCDVMLAGGTEASISDLSIAGFARMKALSKESDPNNGSKPFDRDRNGFVIADGAAVLVLEELSHALKRQSPIIAEIVGYGLSGDSFHISTPESNGDGAFRSKILLNIFILKNNLSFCFYK